MKPSLCLVNPPHKYLSNPGAQAPLGLLYIAANVRRKGFDVSFADLSARGVLDVDEYAGHQVYGITGTVLDLTTVNLVAKQVKRENRNAKVVVGGPVVLSRKYIDMDAVDVVVFGEGERSMVDLMRAYPRIDGTCYSGRITDLDELPFPARDLIDGALGGNVFAGNKEHYGSESTVFCTSRGCPFACAYCASPKLWSRKVTYRSAANIADEMAHVIDWHGVRQFRFSDDNLTTDIKRLYELCDMMEGWDVAWRASIRVRPRGVSMFEKMRRAGCVEVCFGIESGDDEVLRTVGKGTTVRENREAIHNAKEAGLDVRILMMTGIPGETKHTYGRNVKFLESVADSYDAVAVTNFTPLPGTMIAEAPSQYGCRIAEGNGNFGAYNLCLYGPDGNRNEWKNHVLLDSMTEDELTNHKMAMVEYIESTGKANHG